MDSNAKPLERKKHTPVHQQGFMSINSGRTLIQLVCRPVLHNDRSKRLWIFLQQLSIRKLWVRSVDITEGIG